MSFSERHGFKSVRQTIQINGIDEPLRNTLWNLLNIHYWNLIDQHTATLSGSYMSSTEKAIKRLSIFLWLEYFKIPLDGLSDDWSRVLRFLRSYFFDCEWYEVYDFIEFIASYFEDEEVNKRFKASCNICFEKEMSAYRFIDGVITPITHEREIGEIEEATNQSTGPVAEHLHTALTLLSDRKKPNYRNSVKESISAVESLTKIVLKNDKATLGQLLKKLEDEAYLHPAIKIAFDKLYGYASDESGVRHALLDKERVDFEDAKFMLIACSAFVNYIQGKLRKE